MKSIFSALLFCILSISAFSQEVPKFDYFGDVTCDDYLGRMDNAIVAARANPSTTVYVLVYEGKEWAGYDSSNKPVLVFPKFGSADAKIRSMKKYLSKRKVPAERFSFGKAGFRENFTIEIWLVPPGATPPKATPTLTKIKYRKGKPTGFCLDCCGP